MTLKLGRQPRTYNPAIPHWSALRQGKTLAAPPSQVHWAARMPGSLGMMLNDTLGDCTCAGIYHARQVWSFNSSAMETEPDSDVEQLYEGACGYVPGNPSTDQGGVCQNVLQYCTTTGLPVGTSGAREHFSAFIELDPKNITDVKSAINDCGLVYIGFSVPANIMPSTGIVPNLWTVDQQDLTGSLGGHCVVCPGYTGSELGLISWGAKYSMTWNFWLQYVDEAYAIADSAWIEATGETPLGMSLSDLEAAMSAIKE